MNSPDYKEIGKKIRNRRKSLNITQEQVAEYLEVNPSHISNIESGRAHPSLTALINIANCLRCSIDLFISDEYKYEKKKDLDLEIQSKLNHYDAATKAKILKIIDLL